MLKTRVLSYLLLAPSLLLLSPRSVEAWMDSNFTDAPRVFRNFGRSPASDSPIVVDQAPPTPEQKAKAGWAVQLWRRELADAIRLKREDLVKLSQEELAKWEFRFNWKEPIVNPPIVNPPIVNPPIVNPPIVNPPIVNPPIVNPPIVNPPIVNSVDPSIEVLAEIINEYKNRIEGLTKVIRESSGTQADALSALKKELEELNRKVGAGYLAISWFADPSSLPAGMSVATSDLFGRIRAIENQLKNLDAQLQKLVSEGKGNSPEAESLRWQMSELARQMITQMDALILLMAGPTPPTPITPPITPPTPPVVDPVTTFLPALDKEMTQCLKEFGPSIYLCPIRSDKECGKTTCSNNQLRNELKLSGDQFKEQKSDMKEVGCTGRFLEANKKIKGLTRAELHRKILRLRVKLKRSPGDAKLVTELKWREFDYHSPDYFSKSTCRDTARVLQCRYLQIQSAKERLGFRIRKHEWVKRDLFGTLPLEKQNACFDRVILGNGVAPTVIPAADPAITPVQVPTGVRNPGLQLPVADPADE
jgi:hypothetical protein